MVTVMEFLEDLITISEEAKFSSTNCEYIVEGHPETRIRLVWNSSKKSST